MWFAGCSSPEPQLAALPSPFSESGPFQIDHPAMASPRPTWKTRLNGYPTDIALDSSGNELAAATIPSTDRPGGSRKNQIFWLGPQGQVRWRIQPSAPTRSLSMARDGSLLLVNSYDDEILAYTPQGKRLWSAQADCQPFALSSSHLIVCYHDDDADPSAAFDVFDWNGRKLFTRQITSDIVAFKISADEQRVAVGLVKGQVLLFGGSDFHLLAQAQVGGEIIDLAPAGSDSQLENQVAVLFRESGSSSGRRQALMAWVSGASVKSGVANGVATSSVSLGASVDQVAISAHGSFAYFYGNSEVGQFLAALGLPLAKGAPPPGWSIRIPSGSRYDQQILAASSLGIDEGGGVVTAFDHDEGNRRVARVVGYDHMGRLLWTIPVDTEEQAYLYGLTFGEIGKKLAVAVSSDDGRLAVYHFSSL
jgi:hypothetical protein